MGNLLTAAFLEGERGKKRGAAASGCAGVQDKILHKPMLAEERVYASPYTHRARFPSLSPLAGREPERGVPLIVELLPRRILSCAPPLIAGLTGLDKGGTPLA